MNSRGVGLLGNSGIVVVPSFLDSHSGSGNKTSSGECVKVRSSLGDIIFPALKVLVHGVTLVQDCHEIATEETAVTVDTVKESSSGSSTSTISAELLELVHIGALVTTSKTVGVGDISFESVSDCSLVSGVLRLAGVLRDSLKGLREELRHLGLNRGKLILDGIKLGEDLVGVRGGKEFNNLGNQGNEIGLRLDSSDEWNEQTGRFGS